MKYYDKEIYKISNSIKILIIILISFFVGFLSSYFVINTQTKEDKDNTIENQQREKYLNEN